MNIDIIQRALDVAAVQLQAHAKALKDPKGDLKSALQSAPMGGSVIYHLKARALLPLGISVFSFVLVIGPDHVKILSSWVLVPIVLVTCSFEVVAAAVHRRAILLMGGRIDLATVLAARLTYLTSLFPYACLGASPVLFFSFQELRKNPNFTLNGLATGTFKPSESEVAASLENMSAAITYAFPAYAYGFGVGIFLLLSIHSWRSFQLAKSLAVYSGLSTKRGLFSSALSRVASAPLAATLNGITVFLVLVALA